MISDNVKIAIDVLQTHIVQCYESDNVLLIFDNQAELLRYKRKKRYMCPNEILITLQDLLDSNKIDGLRFKRFTFVRDCESD